MCPVHELLAGEVAVAAQLDDGMQSASVYVFHKTYHGACHAERLVPATGSEHGECLLACQPVKYQQRHIAMLVVVGIEQCQLLCTIGVGVSIVCIEDNPFRNLVERGDVLIDKQPANPI